MTDFKDKHIVVTGAGSGLGAAVVKAAVDAGATVWGLDINPDAEQVVNAAGGTFIACDVSSMASWQSAADQLRATAGHIDHLHLNAGIQAAPPEAPLEEYTFSGFDEARYRRLMGVNVDGVVLGLHQLLPLMKRGGSILVTGSLAGVVPYEVDPLYSMTKHAVTGLVRSLVREMQARDLRINALCPGAIDTGIIPHAQRTANAVFMSPAHVAGEVLRLFDVPENGETWAKVAESKLAWVMDPPGRRKRS